MNQDEHRKIEQNMSFMKERLVELKPLIEKLTKNGVFRFEHRHQIEKFSTAHRRFNEFIKILKASPHRDAFVCFLEALNAGGHNSIVQKVQSTVPRQVGFVKSPGKVSTPALPQTADQQTPPASNGLLKIRHAPPTSHSTVTESRRFAFTDRSSTIPTKDTDYSEPGDIRALLEQFQQRQNVILDRRTREMRQEQQNYLREFLDQWNDEKHEMMKEISILKKQHDNLKDKYDSLSSRGTPRHTDKLLDDRGGDLKRSNEDLRNRCSKLSEENQSLQKQCKRLNEKVERQQSQISELLHKQKAAESLVPEVIVEDMLDASVDKDLDYNYATGYGSQRKPHGKK
ncbi:uncharacterized protein [Argopecten irradians]|uniref:uncharacterized protein n=1 Tax=Argopecten irradians TaxID=31199 RepID=UPI00371A8D71